MECSLAEISRWDQAEKDKKAKEEKEEYEMKLPKAIRKYLSAGRRVDDLTCKEIRAIALCVYSEKISKSKRKGEHVAMLKRIVSSNPSKMSAAEARASSESTEGDGNDDDEEEGDEDGTTDEEDDGEEDNNEAPDEDNSDEEYEEYYYERRVAKRHFHNPEMICFGTVTKKSGYRGNVFHWTVKFDDEDAVVYRNDNGDDEYGNLEDLCRQELDDALDLYEERKDADTQKPAAS